MPAIEESDTDDLTEGLPGIDSNDLVPELDDKDLQQIGMDFNTRKSRKTISKPEAEKALRAAEKAARKMNWEKTAKHLLIAWDAAPNDLGILTLLAHSLVQLGVREKAIAVLERALKYHEPTPDICAIMLELAVNMEFHDIAIRIGHQLIAMEAERPTNFVNLATAYSGAERYDEGIEMLQAVLPRFPNNSDLWNVLATMVRLRDGVDAADVFFEESLKNDPNNFKALSNYSQSLMTKRKLDEALEVDMRAIKANPKSPEPRLGAATVLFTKGRLEEGWEYYGFRLDPRRKLSQNTIYTHGLPEWKGEPLAGKAIFVTAEQGIGDELMFGNYLPFLYEEADKLIIGCTDRLVSIYRRRFPDAIVATYRDIIKQAYRYRVFPDVEKPMAAGELKIDYAIPVASSPMFAWRKTEDIKPHPDGFIGPDPERAADFADRLNAISDKPKIGLAWRSGNMQGARAAAYATIDDLGPILELKDRVDFINLQYGDSEEERRRAKELFDVDIHHFEDVDLKMDIEANLAIMANCDLVVAAPSAPAMFSMSCGVSTVLITPNGPWWTFGCPDRVPFVRDVSFPEWQGQTSWAETVQLTSDIVRKKMGF